MKKKVQIHRIPTIKDSALHNLYLEVNTNKLLFIEFTKDGYKGNSQLQPINLYFTSDEKIEEGDWALYLECGTNDEPLKDAHPYLVEFPDESHWNDRKIIATTDKSLNLPQIPQSFIKQYVEAGGIDEVEIEYEVWTELLKYINDDFIHSQWTKKIPLVSFIGQTEERIKVDSNNCVIVHYIKRNFTKEETIYLCRLAFGQGVIAGRSDSIRLQDLENKWIKENLL